MRRRRKQKLRKAPVCIAVLLIGITALLVTNTATLGQVAGRMTVLSAAMALPEGGVTLARENLQADIQHLGYGTPTLELPVDLTPSSMAPSSSQPPASSRAASSAAPNVPASSAAASDAPGRGKISEQTLKLGSNGIKHAGVEIKNTTKNKVDIAATLKEAAPFKIEKNKGPQVLIIHTHTTEGYEKQDLGYYIKGVSDRTTDNTKNIVRVGNEIEAALKKAGIGVVHDTKHNDYPSYSGAYDREEKNIKAYLKQYPSIKAVLDIHRDAIEGSSGVRTKPTAVINGKKATQVMIITGTNVPGQLDFPGWKSNFNFAVKLQKTVADKYPTLMRPIDFCERRYNMHLTKGSLLIEFGTNANTLDEAIYSGKLVGDCIAQTLSSFS